MLEGMRLNAVALLAVCAGAVYGDDRATLVRASRDAETRKRTGRECERRKAIIAELRRCVIEIDATVTTRGR